MRFSALRARRAPLSLSLLVSFVGVLIAPTRQARAEDPMAGPLVDHPAPLATVDTPVAPELLEQAKPASAVPSSPVQAAPASLSKATPSAQLDGDALAAQAQHLQYNPATTPPEPGHNPAPTGLPTGADKTGVSSQAISVPQGAGKIQGMGESFSAQLSTGIATFSVPFVLTPARGTAQPSLDLSYSSAMGHGVAGLGWDIGVPSVSRQTDQGLPGYDDRSDWHPNQDHFVFNGGQELVPICLVQGGACTGALPGEAMPSWGDGWQYFRSRVEGSFQRFFWSPDHRTWRVQDKSGVLMELGQPCTGSSDSNAIETNEAGTRIFRWNLARQFDLEGELPGSCETGHAPNNAVVYRYRQNGGMAYLQDIYTTSPAADPGKAALSTYAHHTRLVYEERTDPTTSYRRGWAVTSRLRLKRLDVTSKPFAGGVESPRGLVHRYHLAYDAQYHPSLLMSVQMEGRCVGSGLEGADDSGNPNVEDADGTLPVSSCPRLPAMTFDYQHVIGYKADGTKAPDGPGDLPGFEGFDERVTTMGGSPDHSVDEELTDLFDVNSDGLPDVLVTAPGLYQGGHGLFLNGGSYKAGAFWPSCSMPVTGVAGTDASVLTLKNLNVSALDLDADGRVDLLHMPKVKTYSVFSPVSKGTCGPMPGWAWSGRAIASASGLAPVIDFGKDTLDLRVVDVNGDGLVDVVHTAGTRVKSYLALGRLPGGDGQFGRGHWTGATTASLSAEPVSQCVPWSGTPVRFSDPDVKLADMNGDGLADLVRVRKGDIRYWPGRGNGLFGTGDLDDCPPESFGQDRSVPMALSPQYADPDGTGLRLDDINGDGLDDLVQVRFNAVDVWLNVDGTGWTKDRHVIANAPTSPAYQNRVRLVDMNGSGTRDLLWGDGLNYRMMDLAGGERPWVLTKVANGLGKTTELTYATSTQLMLAAQQEAKKDSTKKAWTNWTPFPVHVVVKSVEKDHLELAGRPAGAYTRTYAYRDAVYDGRQSEFRGFREAVATQVGDANSPTSSARSVFLLGECEQKGPDGKITACPVSERWKDNPRESLKGLPVISETFDEKGTYLSTDHHTYGLRQLYAGRDGRGVFHAYQKVSDIYLYDTASFAPAASKVNLAEVVFETTTGTSLDSTSRLLELRSSAGRARKQGYVEVDVFGNHTESVDQGCTEGCPLGVPDQVIHSFTTPGRPAGDATGWLWRTTSSYIQGEGGVNDRRHEKVTTYDAKGRQVSTGFVLAGSLELDRFHAQGKAHASSPAQASVDTGSTPRTLSTTTYDDFGQAAQVKGIEHRCRSVVYDTTYADLPVSETTLVGLPSDPGDPFSCGGRELTSHVEQYDRGLSVVLRMRGLHQEETRAEYDGFGRIHQLFAPLSEPDQGEATGGNGAAGSTETSGATGVGLCPASKRASTIIEYELTTNPEGQPFSRMHTKTQDGATAAVDSYIEAWAYVDGMGRTLITLAEADPDPDYGDGHAWIAQGLSDYDAKGASRRAYLSWFWDGSDPRQFPLAEAPPSPYERHRYDAFDREVQAFGLDGAVTLQTRHHALSVDAWDAADLAPGPHQGSYASTLQDGHGRSVDQIERVHAGNQTEERHTLTTYLPTGEVALARRHRGPLSSVPANTDVVRWMRYDSQGRLVLNVDPSTTVNFSPDPTAEASSMKAWRYAYSDAGDLVGTSDARGCGANYYYDAAGRLLAEDYSPCAAGQVDYTPPNLVNGNGTEVFTTYDEYSEDEQTAIAEASAVSNGFNGSPSLLLGRVASVRDRGAFVLNQVDCRGRLTAVAKRITNPGEPTASLADRFAPRWYVQTASYDGADRVIRQSTGATLPELLNPAAVDGKSEVHIAYTANGKVKQVSSSYGTLIHHTHHDADGKTLEIQYGDLARTKTSFTYDDRRRVHTVQTYRGPPSCWTAGADPPAECASYHPTAEYTSGIPATFQLLLEDAEFTYDSVSNPIAIKDWRLPSEWPAGAKPASRSMVYDDLYRLTQIDYQYSEGDDGWVSPFAAEVGTQPASWGPPPAAGLTDQRRAQPSPHVSFPKRVQHQTYTYDWLGNTSASDDDAHGFYDRSLGTITNGGSGASPYQLTAATNVEGSTADPRRGALSAKYDSAGNLIDLAVNRSTLGGVCLPAGASCYQRFLYEWDEVGRLSRARRWDADTAGIAGSPEPTGAAAAELRHHYDGSDQRVLKTSVGVDGGERHSAYVFDSLELKRTEWQSGEYLSDVKHAVVYLFAIKTRLGRVQFDDTAMPILGSSGGSTHVMLEMADAMGSSNGLLDLATSELVERTTYQANGATESDYRPGRWGAVREDYTFTGKEEDVELGISYFGKRYYSPFISRWISPDPLTVHRWSADMNAYAYVGGRLLVMVDPTGLDPLNVVERGLDAVFNPRSAIPRGVTNALSDRGKGMVDGVAYLGRAAITQSGPEFLVTAGSAIVGGVIEGVKNTGRQAVTFTEKVRNGDKQGAAEAATHTLLGVADIVTLGRTAKVSLRTISGAKTLGRTGAAAAAADAAEGSQAAKGSKPPVCSGGMCTGTSCFVAGTTVLTRQGLLRIETILPGDWVWSRNADTGEEGWQQVEEIYQRITSRLLRIAFSTAAGITEVETTEDHPFWVVGAGWTEAKHISSGALVFSLPDRTLEVVSVEPINVSVEVFNLKVSEYHSYFVGPHNIWVHNANYPLYSNQSAGTFAQEMAEATNAGAKVAVAGTAEFEAALADMRAAPRTTRYKYVVTESGELRLVPKMKDGVEIKHPVAVGSADGKVRVAGEAWFDPKGTLHVSEASGHYRPSFDSVKSVAVDAFKDAVKDLNVKDVKASMM